MPSATRCPWVPADKPDYAAYHDREWGVPALDDRRQFEFLLLEGAQAGLSWYTVLRRRAGYRAAFADFDPEAVARFDAAQLVALQHNPAIVRNRAKIEAAVGNARAFLRVQQEFGSFAAYIWRFVDGTPQVNTLRSLADYRATSPESDRLSRDLRQRGFKFVGSTICYAHMQATGLVNDHTLDCARRAELLTLYPPGKTLL